MPVVARDVTDEKILDAARERIMQVGIRRSSLDDIAKRAGINRVTIYRRFSSKEHLIDAVLSREVQRLLAEITAIAETTSGTHEQIEKTVLHVLRQTREHPLVTQLLKVAPEEILEFFTVRGEEGVKLGIQFIVNVLEAAQATGLIAHYDPHPVAELLARLAHSLLLTPAGGIRFDEEQQARAFVRTTIVPLVMRGVEPEEVHE